MEVENIRPVENRPVEDTKSVAAVPSKPKKKMEIEEPLQPTQPTQPIQPAKLANQEQPAEPVGPVAHETETNAAKKGLDSSFDSENQNPNDADVNVRTGLIS